MQKLAQNLMELLFSLKDTESVKKMAKAKTI